MTTERRERQERPPAMRRTFSMAPNTYKAVDKVVVYLTNLKQQPVDASKAFCEIVRAFCNDNGIEIED